MPNDSNVKLRKLQYRLKRQGMLELDAWLSPLQQAMLTQDKSILTSITLLLEQEVPELLAMQSGKKNIPQELKPWLNI